MKQSLSTDRQIAALKPERRHFEVGVEGSRGLRIRVFSTGTKNFEFRYTSPTGERRRLPLGTYPDISLAEARTRIAALRLAVLEGGDPVGARGAKRRRVLEEETLDALAEAYWQASAIGLHGGRKRPKRDSTIKNERQLWANHIKAKLGNRAFAEIRRADVKAFMRDLVTESGLSAASVASIGAVLQGVMGFAVHEDRLEANPVLGLAKPLALISRERLFDDDALRTIWNAARIATQPREPGEKTAGVHARLEPEMGLAIQLLMLTLTRRTEAAEARKSEFDRRAGLWTIPSERAKAKHLHVVPLSAEALRVINEAWALDPDSPFLFPSTRKTGQPLDAHALTRAFARTCERRGLTLGSPHDIRRSGATTLTGRYGVSRFIVGMLLGHTAKEGAAVTSVYDRHTYIPEKRAALTLWAGHLTDLAAGREVGGDRALSPAFALSSGAFDRRTMGGSPPGLEIVPVSTVAADTHLAWAKARALRLCEEGEYQQAVISMCMDVSMHPETTSSHVPLLGKIGLEFAATGSQDKLKEWIDGFR